MVGKQTLDTFEEYAFGLKEGIHTALRNIFEQTIKFAPKVQGSDLPDFLSFVSASMQLLHQHHDHEETIEFPAFAGRGPFQYDSLKQEHEEVLAMMKAIENLVQESKKDLTKYDGFKLTALLTDLQSHCVPHFAEEEAIATAENYRKFCTEKEVLTVHKKILDHAMAQDGTIFVPLMVTNLPPENAQRMLFNEAGWVLKTIIYPWFLKPRHKNWWKFSKYT